MTHNLMVYLSVVNVLSFEFDMKYTIYKKEYIIDFFVEF